MGHEEISRARGLLHRRNEATVTANAPSNHLCLPNASPMETLRTDDIACWVHLAMKNRAAAGPCLPGIQWWHFAVEVQSATVDGGGQPAQRWSTSCVDGVRCVLPTYITNTYPHTPHSRVV